MEYQRIYTDLRTAKMSFAEFMNVLTTVYNLGLEKGTTSVSAEQCPPYFAAAPLGEQFEYRANQ